tara:strand:+ start:42 stop:464 length:423 start_codon:yes stop_codon:yes gene_type:complete
MNQGHAQYLAGLMDGEGWVECRRKNKKFPNGKIYRCWSIRIEIQMTHKEVVKWIHHVTGYGNFYMRKAYPHQNFDQWRWRCAFRDAYKFATDIAPYSIVKKETLQRIVDHYKNKPPPKIKLNPSTNELLHGNNTKIFADH